MVTLEASRPYLMASPQLSWTTVTHCYT